MNGVIIGFIVLVFLLVCCIGCAIVDEIDRKESKRKASVKFWQISQEIEKERR